MAEILQSLRELENIFADFVTQATGLDEKKVLISYESQGRPSFKHGEDIIFVTIFPVVDDREQYKNRKMKYNKETDNFLEEQKSQRTLEVSIVAYGENSYKYSTLIMNAFYMPDYKLMFDRNYLFLVPDHISGVNRVPEQFDGRWWERCDLRARFYNSVNIEINVPAFDKIDVRLEVE